MRYKWKHLLPALALSFTLFWSTTVQAVDVDRKDCSLEIAPCSESSGYAEDIHNLTVDIYQIATAEEDPGYDNFTFKEKEGYEDLGVDFAAISSKTTSKDYEALAQKAAKIALDGKAVTKSQTIEDGSVNKAKFTELETGMYLLIAHDNRKPEEYVTTAQITDPETGEVTEQLVTTALSDYYTYSFRPELISLPTKDAVNGVITTANSGPWIYEASGMMKPTRERRMGSLKIVKELLTYEMTKSASFIFDVEAYLDNEFTSERENVFSNVYSITFQKPGEEFVLIEDKIPAGAEVIVKEVYSGSTYKLVSEPTKTTQIVASDVVETHFKNDYEEDDRDGHSIRNEFTKDTEAWDGWKWNPVSDAPAR